MATEYIISELEHNKRYYGLNGVEITTEDAENVINLIYNGITMDKAVEKVLTGIRDCLAVNWEY